MLNYITLASLPVLGAFIGWLTNYLAIKMLFHPRQAVSFFGIRMQGLLPRRQEEIAEQVAQTVEEEFLSTEQITKVMNGLEFDKDLEEFVDRIIDQKMGELLEGIPLLGSFITHGILDKAKTVFKNAIEEEKTRIIGDIAGQLGHAIDVKQMVYERISDYNIERLEKIVKRIAKKELRHIEYLGAVLGLIIGLLQVGVMYFSGMLSL